MRESDEKISLVRITTPNYANRKIKKLRRIYIFSGSESLEKIETKQDLVFYNKILSYFFQENLSHLQRWCWIPRSEEMWYMCVKIYISWQPTTMNMQQNIFPCKENPFSSFEILKTGRMQFNFLVSQFVIWSITSLSLQAKICRCRRWTYLYWRRYHHWQVHDLGMWTISTDQPSYFRWSTGSIRCKGLSCFFLKFTSEYETCRS